MFVAPNDLFVIRAIVVFRGIVVPLTRSFLAALFSQFLERLDLFPHLCKHSLRVVPRMRVSIGIPGGFSTLACATFVRAVRVPLAALGRVVRILAARRMLGAKLTELRSVVVARGSSVRIPLFALFTKSGFIGDRFVWPTHLGLFQNG